MTPLPKLTPEQIDEAIRLPNGSLPCGIGTTREHAVNAARATEAARDQMWIEMLAGQEPVACSICDGSSFITHDDGPRREKNGGKWGRCLHCQPYTAPQPAKRVPLTDEEIAALWLESICGPLTATKFASAVIAAYDAKNGITGETK